MLRKNAHGNMQSGMSSKKYVIKPFRTHTQMGKKDAEKTWTILQKAITEIFNSNASALSFEELYRNAYNLVLHKHGELLYNGVQTEVENQLKKTGLELAKSAEPVLLEDLVDAWEYHCMTLTMIKDILMYMDRTFVQQWKKTPIYDMGLEKFRDQVVRHRKIKDRVRQQLLDNILKERNGEIIDRDIMRKTLSMLVKLGVNSIQVYQNDFENYFFLETKNFYSVEGIKNIGTDTCPEYLKKVERRLQEEKARSQHYLDSSSEKELLSLVEKELIEKHHKTLVECNTGCFDMFENKKLEDLQRMFRLFSRVPSTLKEVRDELIRYIKEDGEQLVKKEEDDRSALRFVRALLVQRDTYEEIVSQAFHDDKDFKKALKEAFEYVVNMNNKVPHFLTLYVDDLMRERAKKKGDISSDASSLDETLDKIITVFRHLQDKDIFESYHKELLAKRLLQKKRNFDSDFSSEIEERMISKLKAECGQQFTSKLEHMMNDMKISATLMSQYKEKMRETAIPGIDMKTIPLLEVHVLTTGSWPHPTTPDCIIPPYINAICDSYKTFYIKHYDGRKLTWQYNLGSAEVKAQFDDPLTLVVSTYQMLILLLFQDTDTLTYQTIADKTQIPTAELKRHLISLAAPKYKVFKKEPKGKAIAPEHTFTFNRGFKSKVKRVRIPLISSRSSKNALPSAPTEVPAEVEEDRKHLIEAAVVRIMKARKEMNNSNLIAEVIKQLESRFKPSPQNIKKRIEALLEREYIERDEKDRRLYRYVA
mmetsp:Transcript_663/g.868  ORF Transcript_663/g.868 Transcript_663/m.868 type:complete len:762 (-) Transcript_663:538-2823(-)